MKPGFTVFENNPDVQQQLDGLLTVDEVASLLKVPKSWIYAHTRKRVGERLPHVSWASICASLKAKSANF